MYIYIYIHIYIRQSESNFATCFLLEIHMRGFPFRRKLSGKYIIPQNNTNLLVQRISFEKEVPSGGSQVGNISQTSCLIYTACRDVFTCKSENPRRRA